MRFLPIAAACLLLTACAAPQPKTPAQAALQAACQSQAEADYQQNTLSDAGHTAQNGLMFGATPTHVFDAEHMGAQHQYESDMQNCEQTGNIGGQPVISGPPITPHILTN